MIRLSLLQFRAQAITAAAALAAFAILLAATGPHLAARYAASGIGSCRGGSCGQLASTFLGQLEEPYPLLYLLGIAVITLVPAVIGIFWGAPLVAREFEAGTDDLAWNQSITRARWLAVKLAVGALAAVTVTESLSLMQAWWAAPIGRAVGSGGTGTGIAKDRWSSLVFATHGITPLGYAAFAFALGVTAGVLIRRAVPAMAVTLAIFAAVQLAMPLWIRPHLFPPARTTIAIGRGITFNNDPQASWPAPCLDRVQRSRQRRRESGRHRPGLQAGSAKFRILRPGLPGQPRHPDRRHLPAREPLLGPRMDRDRDLPRPDPSLDRVLLPAAQPPPLLKSSADDLADYAPSG